MYLWGAMGKARSTFAYPSRTQHACTHHDHAQCPDVALLIVWLILTQLRAQIVGGAHNGACKVRSITECPGNTQISYLQCSDSQGWRALSCPRGVAHE